MVRPALDLAADLIEARDNKTLDAALALLCPGTLQDLADALRHAQFNAEEHAFPEAVAV